MNTNFELLVTICNRGYAQDVIQSAKAGGATGGTIFHGRSIDTGDVKKFFGISIHPEKDIILIVALTEKKNDIMKAIGSEHGVDSEAHSVCFSVPVDDTVGFTF